MAAEVREDAPLLTGSPQSRASMAANVRLSVIDAFRNQRHVVAEVIGVALYFGIFLTVMLVCGTSCDKPLAVWLSIYCGYMLCDVILGNLSAKRIERRCSSPTLVKSLLVSGSVLGILFEFAWMVVGSVWVFKAGDCSNGIWGLSLTVLILIYLQLFMRIMLGVMLVVVPTRWLIKVMAERAQAGLGSALQVSLTQQPTLELPETSQTQLGQECLLCMRSIDLNARTTRLPCNPQHVFHTVCIQDWLRIDLICPICRKEVRGSSAPQVDSN